jgi:hypothetical protein
MSNLRNQQVHAGHTIRLKVDGVEIGRARSINSRVSFQQEPVPEIGSIKATEHVTTSYNGSVTLDKFKIRRKSLRDLGLARFGLGILNMDVIDIEVTDRHTNDIIEVYRQCSLTEYSSTHSAQALSGENASWVFIEADDGTKEVIDSAAAADFQPKA